MGKCILGLYGRRYLYIDWIEHKGCMSKFNSFAKNEFLTSNAREKYKIVTESYFLYAIVYSVQWLIMQAEHYCYRARVCLKIEQICKDGVPENGHTTFVLVKNILTWTDCLEDKRNMSIFNTFSRNGCCHLYFVESRGSNHGPILGRGLRVQSPQLIFLLFKS